MRKCFSDHWVTILFVAAVLFSTYVTFSQIHGSSDAAKARAVFACDRGNYLRAYLVLRADEVKSPTATNAKQIFTILNCAETENSRPLAADEQAKYLRVFDSNRVPTVVNGKVVGGVPFDEFF